MVDILKVPTMIKLQGILLLWSFFYKMKIKKNELKEISEYLYGYLKMPFSDDFIPGEILEKIIAETKGAERLSTYDFADVIDLDLKLGWQVKSTKESSPLTWKRVNIENASDLINNSLTSESARQILGDKVLESCNNHALKSMENYKLKKIFLSRLIINNNGTITYYEKQLCSIKDPIIFRKEDFFWSWSKPNNQKGKKSLTFIGYNKITGLKSFSWYGMGENQLHFNGEKDWWPNKSSNNVIKFKFPKKHSMDFLKKI